MTSVLMGKVMLNFQFVFLLIALTLLTFVSQAQSAIEDGATPPASDETLIYVLRVKGPSGFGNNFWVAVNDQTVDRVSNGKYAIVRAKAGLVTLNVASQGVARGSIALDDRLGETIYVKWQPSDFSMGEVSEAEGIEFLRNAKRTKGIDTPRPINNEKIAVLANVSRMGFIVTRLATEKPEPDSKHSVITFFRRHAGPGLEFGIWG